MTKYTKTLTAALAAISIAAFAAGCGGGGGGAASSSSTSGRTGNIKLTFKVPGGKATARSTDKIPSGTAKIEVEVEGDGLSAPIEQYVTDFTDVATVELTGIPIGAKQIMIAALDSSDQPLAATVELVEVLDQKTIQLHAELGVVLFDSGVAFPTSISLAAGETLNVKNMSKTSEYSLTIPGVDCPPSTMTFGPNSQLACTFTTAGTYALQANGSTLTTVTVTSATGSIFKADASSSVGYGAPPLSVTFAGRAAGASTSSTVSYSWDFGDGSTSSSKSPTHSFSAEGDYLVTLTATSGSSSSTDYVNIHVQTPGAPTVTAVSPSTASNSAASTIMITGSDFQSGAIVTIGASEATNVTLLSASAISCTVPAGITAGTYDITVTNPDGQSATLAGAFTVTGTSAATYSASLYFPISTSDSRKFIESNGPDGGGYSGVIKSETVTASSSNGTTCYNMGDADYYSCIASQTDGVYMYKEYDTNFNGTSTTTKTITYSNPVKMLNSTFSVGDSTTTTVTTTESSSDGQTKTENVTVTSDVLGVESVAVPAGYFTNAVKIKFTILHASTNVTETDYVWLASGVGEIKDIHTNPSDTYCTGGCPRILAEATVGGISYPSAISATPYDGTFWGIFLNAGSTPSSGFKIETMTNGATTGYGLSGTFTTGDTYGAVSTSGSTFFSNGTYGTSTMSIATTTGLGVSTYDGSARGYAETSSKVIRVYARKGSTYTSTMAQGGYHGGTVRISSSGVTTAEFLDTTISGNTITYTSTKADSTGVMNSVNSGTLTMTLAASGAITVAEDPDLLMLAGENGDVILMTKHAAGERVIGVLVRKGSAMSSSMVTGPFLGVNIGYESTMSPPSYYANAMELDFSSDGNMYGLDVEGSGKFHFGANPFTVGADGRIYSTNEPYLMIGASYDGKYGVGVDLNSLSIAFVMRASNATSTSAALLRQSYPLWF